MPIDPASNSASSPVPPFESGSPWSRGRRFGYRHHHHRHGIFPGLVVIAWGGFLLLRELGLIDPTLRVLDFWPLVLVGFGLSLAARRRGFGGILVGLVLAIFGAGLLAERLGYLAVGVAHLWPVVIIAAGLGIIWKSLTHRHSPATFGNERTSADELQRSVTMGGLVLAVDSQHFKGGALSATMGEIKVDVRRAAISEEEATLDLSLVMGGVEIYVPTNWQVVSDVSPFMGAVEDKTEPRPDGAGVQKRLVLRGKITMGAVTIMN